MIDEVKEMKDSELLKRIVIDPEIMVGKPVIKGTRITVEYILNILSHGQTIEEILEEYDGLTKNDILACILYASCMLNKSDVYPLEVRAV